MVFLACGRREDEDNKLLKEAYDLTDNEAFTIVLEFMISEVSNSQLIETLKTIKKRLEGKNHIEEVDSPLYMCAILMGYNNLFPFRMDEYRKIAEEIKRKETRGKENVV